MICRPLNSILGRAGYLHCAVFVWHWFRDPCTGENLFKVIDAQFSLPRGGTAPSQTPQDNPTYKNDRNSFMNPGLNDQHHNIPPPPNVSQPDFDGKVTTSGEGYSQRPYDAVLGPNSNSAAFNILRGAGGVPPSVSGAWGSGDRP